MVIRVIHLFKRETKDKSPTQSISVSSGSRLELTAAESSIDLFEAVPK